MSAETLHIYGLKPVADFWIEDARFVVSTTDEDVVRMTECIYVFAIGDEILRIGSSKGVLRSRFNAWQRDVTAAMARRRSSTPDWESDAWLATLPSGVVGTVWARKGSTVTTAAGTFNAYMSEESYLIGLHLPRLNRSKHR
jgi:hypothetical protein